MRRCFLVFRERKSRNCCHFWIKSAVTGKNDTRKMRIHSNMGTGMDAGMRADIMRDIGTGMRADTMKDMATGMRADTMKDMATGMRADTMRDTGTGMRADTMKGMATGMRADTMKDMAIGMTVDTMEAQMGMGDADHVEIYQKVSALCHHRRHVHDW